MSDVNRSVQETQDAKVILGIQKDLLNVQTLNLAGKPITPADLEKLVQSRIDSANAIAPAKAKWTAAVQAYKVLNKQVTQSVRALRTYVINTYGPTSTVLADFGFSPPKAAVKTPEVKATAADKALATRKARNTLGKKQKLAIKGTVTTPAPASPATATPPVATSAPTPPRV
jgi:hypothetical protein